MEGILVSEKRFSNCNARLGVMRFGIEKTQVRNTTLKPLEVLSKDALYAWDYLGFDRDDGDWGVLLHTDGLITAVENPLNAITSIDFATPKDFVKWLDYLGYNLAHYL